ncbi:hypothetical protein GCM10027300_41850 [Modestobacter lapidis]
MQLLDEFDGDPGRPLQAVCLRCDAPRTVAWTAVCSGTPPCIRCDGARLDPDAPHRVYLVLFAHLGDVGVYKVGITHCVTDDRLRVHERSGGVVLDTMQVRDRATALAIERRVLEHYLPAAAVALRPDLLPHGGTTECWSAHAGRPNLSGAAAGRPL